MAGFVAQMLDGAMRGFAPQIKVTLGLSDDAAALAAAAVQLKGELQKPAAVLARASALRSPRWDAPPATVPCAPGTPSRRC